jgi:hypothetical protein
VLEALDAPGRYPPVENRGRGIVDEGVLMDPEGGMWFQLYDPSGRSNEWVDGPAVQVLRIQGAGR